jgi:hypothetical protein
MTDIAKGCLYSGTLPSVAPMICLPIVNEFPDDQGSFKTEEIMSAVCFTPNEIQMISDFINYELNSTYTVFKNIKYVDIISTIGSTTKYYVSYVNNTLEGEERSIFDMRPYYYFIGNKTMKYRIRKFWKSFSPWIFRAQIYVFYTCGIIQSRYFSTEGFFSTDPVMAFMMICLASELTYWVLPNNLYNKSHGAILFNAIFTCVNYQQIQNLLK